MTSTNGEAQAVADFNSSWKRNDDVRTAKLHCNVCKTWRVFTGTHTESQNSVCCPSS